MATITFTEEDMLLGRAKHNRPLYHTGYIGDAPLLRVQVDPGSEVNVMPLKALALLEIPANQMSYTNITIL